MHFVTIATASFYYKTDYVAIDKETMVEIDIPPDYHVLVEPTDRYFYKVVVDDVEYLVDHPFFVEGNKIGFISIDGKYQSLYIACFIQKALCPGSFLYISFFSTFNAHLSGNSPCVLIADAVHNKQSQFGSRFIRIDSNSNHLLFPRYDNPDFNLSINKHRAGSTRAHSPYLVTTTPTNSNAKIDIILTPEFMFGTKDFPEACSTPETCTKYGCSITLTGKCNVKFDYNYTWYTHKGVWITTIVLAFIFVALMIFTIYRYRLLKIDPKDAQQKAKRSPMYKLDSDSDLAITELA